MTAQMTANDTGLDAQHMPSNERLSVLQYLHATRHSCRAFSQEEVPDEVIEAILATAQRTATWCNTQHWHVYLASGEATNELRHALRAHVSSSGSKGSDIEWPREYRGVHLERRREAGFRLYNALGIGREDGGRKTEQMLESFRFFGAPHVAIITSDEALGPYGLLDCGGYVANFLLAATACGVATVAQAAIAQYAGFIRDYFKIPADRNVVCAISFGRGDPNHAVNSFRTSRAAIADAVTRVV